MDSHKIETGHNMSAGKQGIKRIGKTSSKYVGVYNKRNTHWGARIQYRGKAMSLGTFSIKEPNAEEKAARAYDKKAVELFGKNAKLNFPIE